MENRLSPRDWQRLRVLRDRFLHDATEEYWTPRDLELYDAVFAPRIAWKWAAALASLDRAGWRPRSMRLLDWGGGTGVASRCVAEWSGLSQVEIFDQSRVAAEFAVRRLRESGVAAAVCGAPRVVEPGTLLVISHVAGELTDDELGQLAKLAATADEVIWVEPGSREISRRLSGVRETLRAGGHRFAAPCTRAESCPMRAAENERHWCHFFARPPAEVFQSPFWREVSRQVEIDLRSLPYSFLVGSRLGISEWPEGAERLIGHPRERKAHCQLLCCGRSGLVDRMLQRRDEPELYRRVTKKGADGVFAWEFDADRPDRVKAGRIIDESPPGATD